MKNKVKVAIAEFSPLIINESGSYTGFEIELWESIANDIGLDFEYENHNFQDLIPLVTEKRADIALAGITVNEKREKIIDFSHPTLESGLLILSNKNKGKIKIFGTLKSFLHESYEMMLSPFLWVLGFLVLFAHLLWWAESGAKTFSSNYFPGIFESAWLVICSMSTDSFGDYVPHTWVGRIVTTGIIVGGVAIFGLLIAQVTAFIAVRKIRGDINNYHDLSGKKVATVKDSTSVAILRRIGASVIPVVKIEEAYLKLKNKEVAAVVFDAPVITYYAENEGAAEFEIVGDLFDKQRYGVVCQTGSPLRENINRTILKLRENGQYDSVYRKWFGEDTLMES